MIRIKVNNKRLINEMARQCLNSNDLASICGLSNTTINRLRLEGAMTQGKTLGIIAKALKIDVDELITE
ncbi:hypothetical protein [uncultured Fusobacterium sp.]|uniref:hypothetical protein n=1 Tax=uncultured Fusobacterium sp. TaxID=159267 RepID=UPI002805515A|nr:hypothetical protein [uncultured Fusobacterium sp.]